MAHDQVFGDTRIDVFDEPELLGPLKSGPASRQSVFLPDEDMTVRFTGFTTRRLNQMLWRICCFASFGLLGLLGHWFPLLWLKWVCAERAFVELDETGFIVVEVRYKMIT
jgi:cation-transporting ATPase 13A3/4/5